MRAVHVGQEHSIDDIRIVRKECASLVTEGIDVVYITQQKDKAYFGEKICGVSVYTYVPYKLKFNIPLISVRVNLYFSRKRAARMALKLNGDIYHIHELSLWSVAKRLKKRGKRIIFDQHEDSPGQIYQNYLEVLHSRFVAAVIKKHVIHQEKSMVKNSELVIAASEMIAENLQGYKINNNIMVIHNYADKSATQCNMSDYQKRDRCICYAGGLFARRGIKYVIDAMDLVDGIFEFAGGLDNRTQKTYENSAGWDKCKYLGSISRSEVNRLYERSRVGIINNLDIPYHRNSNPNKLFEYMAAGLPIVCTSIPAWAQIVKEAGCGLVVNATNTEEIATAINYLLDNPKKAQQMGQNGYQAFMNIYNWDAEKDKLISEYYKLDLKY